MVDGRFAGNTFTSTLISCWLFTFSGYGLNEMVCVISIVLVRVLEASSKTHTKLTFQPQTWITINIKYDTNTSNFKLNQLHCSQFPYMYIDGVANQWNNRLYWFIRNVGIVCHCRHYTVIICIFYAHQSMDISQIQTKGLAFLPLCE